MSDIDDLTRRLDSLTGVMRDVAAARRLPSMAAQIGQGTDPGKAASLEADLTPSPALARLYSRTNGAPGSLLTALLNAGSRDADEQRLGKATLEAFGLAYRDAPEKATLGATGATGGYVLPNNLVDTVVKPAVGVVDWGALLKVRTGVNVRGVDQPYRTGAPARATFQDWGATKENVNEAYGSYTAVLGTLARIYDISKQYARFSAGAAEADVIDELGKAMQLGEEYYILAGAGTGSTGTGDPTTGLYTALTKPGLQYTTSFSGTASNSTVAGSAANGITNAQKTLAGRSRRAEAVVMDANTYFQLWEQGNDNAGFYMSPLIGAGFTVTADGGLMFRGVPILYSPNFDSFTGTTKAAIVGEFSAVRFYRGLEFRIESSDVAGTRWDTNLIGFRGEEEIGINAQTAVNAGALQLLTGLIP